MFVTSSPPITGLPPLTGTWTASATTAVISGLSGTPPATPATETVLRRRTSTAWAKMSKLYASPGWWRSP